MENAAELFRPPHGTARSPSFDPFSQTLNEDYDMEAEQSAADTEYEKRSLSQTSSDESEGDVDSLSKSCGRDKESEEEQQSELESDTDNEETLPKKEELYDDQDFDPDDMEDLDVDTEKRSHIFIYLQLLFSLDTADHRKYVSRRQYLLYTMLPKGKDWKSQHHIWWGRKLAQFYTISQWMRLEADRIKHLKLAQRNLRDVLPTSLIEAFEKMIQNLGKKSM